MHTVRVYLNREQGARWWAEDDLGFTGGADRLADLIEAIHDWAGCEDVLDDLAIRLVDDVPEVPTINPLPTNSLESPKSSATPGFVRAGPAMIVT